MTARTLALALLLGTPQAVITAQAPRDSTADAAAFVRAVRTATERYRDQSMAVVDGYRPIGPDFPGMGEHWISVPLLLAGVVDPLHPPILEYARLDGEMTLVGAAFAVLLDAHEQPPTTGLPVDASAWHYHGGTVSEESFVVGHAAEAAHGRHNGGRPTVAVLHVWAWLANPAGAFATDNWALPFARLGLPVPDTAPSTEVGHALALAAGGERYYLAVAAASAKLDSAARDRAVRAIAAAAESIREELRRVADAAALARMAERWQALRQEVAGLP